MRYVVFRRRIAISEEAYEIRIILRLSCIAVAVAVITVMVTSDIRFLGSVNIIQDFQIR